MSIGMLFWVLMIIWVVVYGMYNGNPTVWGSWGWAGPTLLLFILLAILGWHAFGGIHA